MRRNICWMLNVLVACVPLVLANRGPFLEQVGNTTWIFGNDLWNVTQEAIYASKLHFRGAELVGPATGHYMGYDGENNFVWTSAEITSQGENWTDVSFSCKEGELHWVVFDDLAGAYQFFINRALPEISILRTLWRLDPNLFPNGRTYLRDQALPDFSLYQNASKVQDETWQLANGSFITKYDFSDYVRDRDFYGVYGPKVGSWYIHPGTDYYNSDHLSQTLTVHRESASGDSVQLNVVQDTSHFRVGEKVAQPAGKIWGPWLWYLNDGQVENANTKANEELSKWPYPWLEDPAYQSRGRLTGRLRLSDGRTVFGAAVFLGDTDKTRRPSVQGRNYYYTTQADAEGRFSLEGVRSGTYGLYTWSNGGAIKDVYTNFSKSDIDIVAGATTQLSSLTWNVPDKGKRIFTIGDFDKKALGFRNGGPPYQHGVSEQSPASLTFTVGKSEVSDWYYAQSLVGTWTVEFDLDHHTWLQRGSGHDYSARLSLSFAGYSQSAAMEITINGRLLGSLGKDSLASDPSLYRSGKTSGEWRFVQYTIPRAVLSEGINVLGFTVTRYTQWRGFMWDSIILEWV